MLFMFLSGCFCRFTRITLFGLLIDTVRLLLLLLLLLCCCCCCFLSFGVCCFVRQTRCFISADFDIALPARPVPVHEPGCRIGNRTAHHVSRHRFSIGKIRVLFKGRISFYPALACTRQRAGLPHYLTAMSSRRAGEEMEGFDSFSACIFHFSDSLQIYPLSYFDETGIAVPSEIRAASSWLAMEGQHVSCQGTMYVAMGTSFCRRSEEYLRSTDQIPVTHITTEPWTSDGKRAFKV
jgi:hypothetical protein